MNNISNDRYIVLNPDCSLKHVEYGCVYDKKRDELYKLSPDALKFMKENQNIHLSALDVSTDEVKRFADYLIREHIMLKSPIQTPRREFLTDENHQPTLPSLRYLLMHITRDCNLRCRHCYAAPDAEEPVRYSGSPMSYSTIERTFEQMQDLQGLNILLSGGEPLCHPDFWKINEILPRYNLRFELLSNGTLLTPDVVNRLNTHHVQISLDGLEGSHDFMRGRGSFQKSIQGIENMKKAGKNVSISTMIHYRNVDEFEQMRKLLDGYDIKQWIINQPSLAGRWRENSEHGVPIETGARIMIEYSRGEGPHESKTNFTCGSHIAAIMEDGSVYPCPFLNTDDMFMGNVETSGLRDAWKNRKGIELPELEECKPCEYVEKCRGGCRFRAKEEGNVCGKDSVMCTIYKKKDEKQK